MQWTAGPQAGFTSGTPWLPVNPTPARSTPRPRKTDPASVLLFYRRLIALRKRMPALVYGLSRDIDPEHPTVFAYTRTLPGAACLVLMNFGSESVVYDLPVGVIIGETLLSSEPGSVSTPGAPTISLVGWQSLVLMAGSTP